MEMSKLRNDMSNCEQTKGMSVLEHGESVNRYFDDLYNHITIGTELKYEWKLPNWIQEHKDLIVEKLLDRETIDTYQVYHDCGKPYCCTVDDEGRQHFPDHAAMSENTWLKYGGSEQVARLIGMDMVVHTMKAEDIPDFVLMPEAMTLLITALCEVHSNCAMFGGIESTSFKIKWKHLDKRGRAILKILTT